MEFRDNPIIHSLNVEEWERLPSDLVSIQWYPSNPKKQREKQGETSFGSVCIYVLWPSTASVTFQVSTFPFISLQYYQPFLTSTDSFYNYWILIQILLSLSLSVWAVKKYRFLSVACSFPSGNLPPVALRQTHKLCIWAPSPACVYWIFSSFWICSTRNFRLWGSGSVLV